METLLETIHSVEAPNRKRVPGTSLSVICAGMPRTGSSSLKIALETLGYGDVYHGVVLTQSPSDCKAMVEAARLQREGNASALDVEFWERILGTFGAIADMPAASYVEELVRAYPQAKVILNEREVDGWVISMRLALESYLSGRKYYEIFDKQAFWMRRYTETNSDPFYDGDFERNAKAAYEAHYKRVRKLVPKDRLLEWRGEDGWEPLCKFLGCPVPKMEFPFINTTAQIRPRLAAKHNALKQKADRYIAISVSFVGVLIAVTSHAWYRR